MFRTNLWRGCAAAALLTLTACGGITPPAAAPLPATQTIAAAPSQPDSECAAVEEIAAVSPEGQKISEALLAALPATQTPDLQALAPYAFDEVWSIARMGNWIVVQASFKEALEPGIFVLESTPDGYHYQGLGWAGMAESAVALRSNLAANLPDNAKALALCIDLSHWNVG